ncbi:MAG: efflux RND transporter periplasmic adaptor subunit [Pseudomonadota bacterium]
MSTTPEEQEPEQQGWKSRFKRHFFLFGALGLVAAMVIAGTLKLAASAATSGSDHAPGGHAVQVSVVTAQLRPFADTIDVLGTAKGQQSVNLSSNTTELITAVHFHDGDIVRRGQVLVDLKAKEEQADVDQARAALDVARNTYERYQRLAQAGFLSPSAMEQYEANYRQAQASLAAAESRESDRVIRAPFSGRLGLGDVAPGALINPGATIVTLDDVSVMRVDFDVPDRFLPALNVGAPITARPDPYPNTQVTGHIANLDSRIDPATHTLRARAEFPNPSGVLVPGMLLHVQIANGQRQAVSVPEAAVQSLGDQSYVFAVQHQGERTIAQQIEVETGVNSGGFVEIRQGVNAGVQVVADGLDRITPNGPIRIAAPHNAPPGAQHGGAGATPSAAGAAEAGHAHIEPTSGSATPVGADGLRASSQ